MTKKSKAKKGHNKKGEGNRKVEDEVKENKEEGVLSKPSIQSELDELDDLFGEVVFLFFFFSVIVPFLKWQKKVKNEKKQQEDDSDRTDDDDDDVSSLVQKKSKKSKKKKKRREREEEEEKEENEDLLVRSYNPNQSLFNQNDPFSRSKEPKLQQGSFLCSLFSILHFFFFFLIHTVGFQDGLRVVSEESLRMNQGGNTPHCPFDCNCCF